MPRRAFRALATAVAFGAALLALPGSGRAQGGELRIAGDASPRTFPIATHRGYPALPLTILDALGAEVETTTFGARAVLNRDTLDFDLYSPIFLDAGKPRQLVAPVYKHGGTIYLPAQLLTEILPESRPGTFTLRDGVLHLSRGSDGGAPATASPTRPRAQPAPAPARSAPEDPGPRVVIIDPGHGGRDPGNIGAGGVREKDLTLQVSRRLAELLRERGGYEVHLTRSADTLIALDDRPHMANRWKANRPAALFISIHANSVSSPRAAGFETFFLSEARTEDERRVAEMENSAIEYEDEVKEVAALDDLGWIFNTLRNDFYIRASNDLAETIQKHFASFHPGPNRGVKQAGFRVLVGAFMPAVLVELAFLSNPTEAKLLSDAAFQRKIVQGLAAAIDDFFTSHEHLWSAEPEMMGGRR